MSHRDSRMTRIMSHNLVISILYESQLSEDRVYTVVKAPETRALHATMQVLSSPILDQNNTIYSS